MWSRLTAYISLVPNGATVKMVRFIVVMFVLYALRTLQGPCENVCESNLVPASASVHMN